MLVLFPLAAPDALRTGRSVSDDVCGQRCPASLLLLPNTAWHVPSLRSIMRFNDGLNAIVCAGGRWCFNASLRFKCDRGQLWRSAEGGFGLEMSVFAIPVAINRCIYYMYVVMCPLMGQSMSMPMELAVVLACPLACSRLLRFLSRACACLCFARLLS